jgi:hypothetical protein
MELRGRVLSGTYGTRSKRPNFYIPNSEGRELHEQWIIPTIFRSNFKLNLLIIDRAQFQKEI